MRYGVRVLCRPEVGAGFRLAGLRPIEAPDPATAARLLTQLLREPGVGAVLIEDACHRDLPEALHRELARRPLPMVVPFPGPSWTAPQGGPEAYIAELLRQAIGYRVRLK